MTGWLSGTVTEQVELPETIRAQVEDLRHANFPGQCSLDDALQLVGLVLLPASPKPLKPVG